MPRDIFIFWQSPQPLSVSGELAGDLADSLPMAYSEDGTPLCFRQSPDDVPDQAFLSFDGTSDPWLDGGILRTAINDAAMQAYFDMSEPLGRCASYLIYEAKGLRQQEQSDRGIHKRPPICAHCGCRRYERQKLRDKCGSGAREREVKVLADFLLQERSGHADGKRRTRFHYLSAGGSAPGEVSALGRDRRERSDTLVPEF
jgi:hypothetical protein